MGTKYGVAAQSTPQTMRHADYRTTQKHYTVMGVTDTSKHCSSSPTSLPKTSMMKATSRKTRN